MSGASDSHLELLIATCEGRHNSFAKQRVETLLASEELDPVAFIQNAIHHRVGATVFSNLQKWDLMWRVRSIANRTLHEISIGTRITNQMMRREASSACAALLEAGVKCAVIKGPATEELAYAGLEERHYADIDLLVSREDLLAVKGVLNALGFSQGRYRGRQGILPATRSELLASVLHTHETVPFVKLLPGDLPKITLDVNFKFAWQGHPKRPSQIEIDPKDLLPHAQRSSSSRPQIPMLSPEFSLLGLSAHLMSEATLFAFANSGWATTKSDHLLSRNVDIYYLVSVAGLDWDVVERVAATPGAAEALRYALQSTKQVFPSLSVPPHWLETPSSLLDFFITPSGELASWEASYLERLMLPEARMADAKKKSSSPVAQTPSGD